MWNQEISFWKYWTTEFIRSYLSILKTLYVETKAGINLKNGVPASVMLPVTYSLKIKVSSALRQWQESVKLRE